MANTKFTLENGTIIEVAEDGQIWQGFVTVDVAGVEIGDQVGSGCGLHTFAVVAKETIEEEA